MVRIGVLTGRAPSLLNVANDIATVYGELNHDVMVFHRQIPFYEAKRLFEKCIIFMPFDPAYIVPYIVIYRDYLKSEIDTAFYTTVEGRPIDHMITDWMRRDVETIAVSNYVKEKLEGVDIRVIGVIWHGIDLKLIGKVHRDVERLRRLTGGEVIYGTVASSHRRKGLDLLAEAIKLTQDKINAGFYILTEPEAQRHFAGLRNVYVDTRFGKLDRQSVLRLISSVHFYICSSLCEGFCLPLLEAQALGVPVIYPDYAPLNEFINPKINFPFDWERIEDYREKLGIIYELHVYRPEALAERIIDAYNLYTSSMDEYVRMGSEAKRYVHENFDIRKMYTGFNKYLRL